MWGCLVLIVFIIFLAIIALWIRSVGTTSAESAQRTAATSEDQEKRDEPRDPVEPVCTVTEYIDGDPSRLYAALRETLGGDAVGERGKAEDYWITDAKFSNGKMQVFEKAGALDQINVWFDSPVHRDDALALFGLPTDVSPTRRGPAIFIWDGKFGIDRVRMLRVRGTDEVTQAMIEIR
jgi:hypothetical protein